MSQSLTSVTCDVTAFVSVSEDRRVPLPSRLRYDPTDPYAVRLSLGATMDGPVVWTFARALLVEGMRRPSGAGDVLVLPRHPWLPDTLRVVLRSRAGAALVELPVPEVARFLDSAGRLVPPGTECAYVDVDSGLAQLTGRSD
ncbi:SsgA family sporulation/cell division regulator [Streptomyces sp. NBC_01335]|uniref:SsgA family sporulation/cell division regulator n=1 Tax=Streptomyces sp. NBC_01335 TaxID=2903828 RepID=UPI002E162270|nr:SsgA family sporulation/cell division regulator [Streptomyces sp. NBC_01335]